MIITMNRLIVALLLALFFPLDTVQAAGSMTLHVLRFAEGREVRFTMLPTRRIGEGQMEGRVRYDNRRARIELRYQRMKPAVLFSGDVTCYVVWAVNRDGAPQNLGEFWVDPERDSGRAEFSTGLRNFALVITAEAYYQVDRPSELVMFWNDRIANPPVEVDEYFYDTFEEAPNFGVETLATVRYDGRKPLDLVQAEKVFEMARNLDAERHAPELFDQAAIALEQATVMYERSRDRGAERFSRRSAAASNEAIGLSLRRIEMERMDALISQRQREMADLERRAEQAETTLQRISAEREAALASVEEFSRQLEALQQQRAGLEEQTARLRGERDQMQQSMRELREERTQLQSRLQGALSMVAETRESARGLIVNLPDILFDVGEATLRSDARMTLAKLAGILLIMPDLNVRIEGHTDSTGSAALNQSLSERRAGAVFDLLAAQGVSSSRMTRFGYGLDRPIADNSTAQGRQRNRRVELIIAEGEIREES
jgi:outer membrane protein OmpA-like peptidoglycan-associated protein